jgi:hypothetical protein
MERGREDGREKRWEAVRQRKINDAEFTIHRSQ